MSRLFSALIAVAYLALAIASKAPELILKTGFALLIPLALIWFPEQLGSFTGWYSHGCEARETPPVALSVAGWLILVGLPVLYFGLSDRPFHLR